jgi:putative DNA primase/helicase
MPIWVSWQTENRKDGKPTKVPYGPDGRRAKADAPATWGTRPQAEAMAARLPKPHGIGGVGIEFPPLGNGRSLGGVDLDTCRNPATGTLEPWAHEIADCFSSYTEISPSGTGAKIFFTYDTSALDRLRAAMGGAKFGKQFKRGGGDHPPAIELHLGNRYFAITEQSLSGFPNELRHVETDTILRLLQITGPNFAGAHEEPRGDDRSKSNKASPTDRSRSALAFAKGKALRRSGATFEQMVEALRADPETAEWTREKGEADGQRELRRIWEKTKPSAAAIDGFDLTEDGLALAFAKAHQDLLRYDHTRRAWFQWTGKSWRHDETRLAFSWSRGICRKLGQGSDVSAKTSAILAKASTAAAVERFAQSDPALAVTSAIWDRDPFLLGTPEGTVDLRTGNLREPTPEDYITKLTAVSPAAAPDCPLWLAFMEQVTGADRDLTRFLRQWCGYCLSGDVTEHALLFAHGPGGNGKGVFLNTVRNIFGGYASNAAMDTFTASTTDKHPTDLAMLRGARLVTASETEDGRAWAESRIKSLTGGDPITARFMRQDFFEYSPQFKLTIIGNHKPVLRNVDDAARRRFNIVPFLFKPKTVDRELESKLRAEWPGILRWMIDGCLDWQMHGLVRPGVVTEATAEYFSEQDTVNQWVEECCILAAGQFDTLAVLFKSWTEYALANGEKPGTTKWFSQTVAKLGCEPVKNTPGAHGKRGFMGIGVRLPTASPRHEPEEREDATAGGYGDAFARRTHPADS